MSGSPSVLAPPLSPVPTVGQVHLVPLAALRFGGSPRLGPLRDPHVDRLREVLPELPPVLVHRSTMQVIDGMHRVAAYRRSGLKEIPVLFCHGTAAEAFVTAVRSNIAHGLPLSLAERRHSASRILADLPGRSDRWVATMCGLSPATVARVRGEIRTPAVMDEVRTGADGRRRPVKADRVRERIRVELGHHPGASVRQVARAVGASVSTVHAVMVGLRSPSVDERGGREALGLRGLDAFASPEPPSGWQQLVAGIPGDDVGWLVAACRRRAAAWASVAEVLERRLAADVRHQPTTSTTSPHATTTSDLTPEGGCR